MKSVLSRHLKTAIALAVLMVVQIVCAAFCASTGKQRGCCRSLPGQGTTRCRIISTIGA